MPRKPRVKAAESSDGLFADVLIMEREAGTGHRDRVQRGTIWYERFRISVLNAKGVKERITIYGKTPAELTRKIKKRLATPARTADIAKMTVESYFNDRFLPGAKPTIRPNTYASYENTVEHPHRTGSW